MTQRNDSCFIFFTNLRSNEVCKGRGFTLIEIMIVVAILALLAGAAMSSMFRPRMLAMQVNAKTALRTIATALEAYAAGNRGRYPGNDDDGVNNALRLHANPPYLNRTYCGETVQMYTYECDSDVTGYEIRAIPDASFENFPVLRITTGVLFDE